jgi:phage host-nuclease inhibitor protein Gam
MKNTKRIKVTLPLLTTRDDAEFALSELAIAVNQQRKITADRDAAVLAINQRVEGPLGDLDQVIKQHTDALRAWAEANPDQFPRDRKSIIMTSGTLGFRTGTPKLALISRAFTWEKVLDCIKASKWAWAGFIRTKEEVDKDAILGTHSQVEDKTAHAADLRSIGLKVVQDETFFVDPDLTKLQTRQTVPN